MGRDAKIKRGQHLSRSTEFRKGQHWRQPRAHWKMEWLDVEYVSKGRSASDIAAECGCTENNILFWLKKHGINRRTMSETRSVKHWGCNGEANPMYGRTGELNPRWRGGLTPLRQRIYAKSNWKVFARAVRKRDKCCRLCESTERTEIHHIDPFSQSPLLVMDIGNVILLCGKCHKKMQGKEKRWKRKLLLILASPKAC